MGRIKYEHGTVKVVWIKEDLNKIYSCMFEDLPAAKKFAASKKDFLIFTLDQQKNMETFSWTLLPYGGYKKYKFVLNLYRLLTRIFR